MDTSVETFWEEILSRQPERIQEAFTSLNGEEKTAVIKHLQRMVSESGWHPEQIASANKALKTLHDQP